ncbi:MAG: EamA family transporter [Acidimicrobiia bacterium]
MTAGVWWALVAALGFGLIQASNRKANQIVDAFRSTFGLLLTLEVLLLLRAALAGQLELAATAPLVAVALFTAATSFHFVGGWTLVALSQQRIGVARTGALVSAAPLMGTLLASIVLDEPLSLTILGGVSLAVLGVALISFSGSGNGEPQTWARPWLALTVAVIWGSSPLLIRLGLEEFDHPVLGLTIGLGISMVGFTVAIASTGSLRKGPVPPRARRWMMIGGLAGAVAVSAQWTSFGLTTVAIALTVQQLSALVVVALVPIMFKEPFERMNLKFLGGMVAMLAGSVAVVLSGR